MKRTYRMGEIFANNATDKSLISKIYNLTAKKKKKNLKLAKDLNRYFSKEDIQMKRCSKSLIIREIQIKTAMRYHLTLIRMAIIQKFTNNKC